MGIRNAWYQKHLRNGKRLVAVIADREGIPHP
jgi:hypothetical protein